MAEKNRLEIEVLLGDKASKSLDNIQKKTDTFSDKVKKNFVEIAAKTALVVTAFKTFEKAISSVVEAASRQEDAVKKLNTQLEINGQYTAELSDYLVRYADELQSTTRFSNDAIIKQEAFAMAMGASADQAKQIVKVSADMAASLNIDLNAATRNVTKTLGGFAGELGEVIPSLKNLTQEQLRAGEGVNLLATLFAGAAQKDAQTFSGSIDQLKNAWDDFNKTIGNFLINNPVVKEAITGLTNGIQNLIKEINTYTKDQARFESEKLIEQLDARVKEINAKIVALKAGEESGSQQIAFMEEQLQKINSSIRGYEALSIVKELSAKQQERYNELLVQQQRLEETISRMQLESADSPENLERINALMEDRTALMLMIAEQKQKIIGIDQQQNIIDLEAIEIAKQRAEEEKKAADALLATKELESSIANQALATAKTIQTSLGNAFARIIDGTMTAKEAMKEFGSQAVATLANFIAQQVVAATIGKAMTVVLTTMLSGMAATISAAFAPAAAAVSLATLGGNAAPAIAGMATTHATAMALFTPKAMAYGGEGVVNKPTLFLAGENGPESYNFTPLDNSSSSGIIVHIGNITIGSKENISDLAEELGFEIERGLRYARGI